MAHYFENDETLKSEKRSLNFAYKSVNLTLLTDVGVFSKNEIDEGSIGLLNVVTSLDLKGKILDVGCGYGTLGLTIAKLFPLVEVTMFDINERAVDLTKQNISTNNINNAQVFVASTYQALTKDDYTTIVINPPIRAGKQVYYPLLSEAFDYLTDGGTLYFVIRRSHGALSAQRFVKEKFTNCELVKKHHGFYIYKAVKRYKN
jgi:16S rRNA (guanine1207-N2)-methyltransferase